MRTSTQTTQLQLENEHKKALGSKKTLFINHAPLKRISLLTIICLLALFFSQSLFAQTFPADCPSNDLEVVSASLPPPGNDPCACGGTRTLMLGINNKTSSERTSFGLWGTLVIKNSAGQTVSTEQIFACAGPIPKNKISVLPSSKQITFTCGQSLSIINMHLAWTSASDKETCAVLEAHPELIAPKCGVAPSIAINIGVSGTLDLTSATCTGNDGSIKVTPTGGAGSPYKVQLGATTERTNITTNTTFSTLASGDYTVKVTDKSGCVATLNCTVAGPSALATPAATVTQQPTCTVTTGTVTVTSPNANYTYKLFQSDVEKYTANSSGVFNNVAIGTYTLKVSQGGCSTTGNDVTVNTQPAAPTFTVCLVQPTLCTNSGSVTVTATGGSNFTYQRNALTPQSSNVFSNLASGSVTSITVTNGAGCSITTLCDNLVISCSSASRISTGNYQPVEEQIIVEEQAKVTAYPNPFSDKVKFVVTSAISGKGSLEVYNMLGQKIKSVYQGLIIAGNQNFELSLPSAQRSNLIYVLNVGDRRVTGKLLHLNR